MSKFDFQYNCGASPFSSGDGIRRLTLESPKAIKPRSDATKSLYILFFIFYFTFVVKSGDSWWCEVNNHDKQIALINGPYGARI